MPNQKSNRLSLIQLRISSWSGWKGLSKDELSREALDLLPPDQLGKLGSKRLVNSKHLRVFDNVRRRAHAQCSSLGVNRGQACYILSEDDAHKVIGELEALKEIFNAEVEDFITNLPERTEAWLSQFGEWRDLLSKEIPSSGELRTRFRFGWVIFDINPDPGHSLSSDCFEEEVSCAGADLMAEIAKSATGAVDTYIVGKDYATPGLIDHHLTPICEKLASLAMLNRVAEPLAEQVANVRDGLKLTSRKRYEGEDFKALQGVLLILSDSDRAIRHGEALLDGEAPSLFNNVASHAANASPEATVGTFDWDNVSVDVPVQTPESTPGGFVLDY